MIPAESLMRSLETGLPSQYDDRAAAQIAFSQRFPGSVWQHCPAFIAHAESLSKFGTVSSPGSPDTATHLKHCQCEYHGAFRALLAVPPQYDAKPGPRIYQRVIERCGQCHCINRGTQFRPTLCSQTGQEVQENAAPPAGCPLPLA